MSAAARRSSTPTAPASASGISSVCSAHPLVLEALHRPGASPTAAPLLIEATCNQVNQEGGYTGMPPADFRDFVEASPPRAAFPPSA